MSISEKSVGTPPIQLTPGAIAELKRIAQEQRLSVDHGLRIGVKGGGCSGFSYILGFDQPKENDQIFDIQGIRVFMQKAHALYLLGMEIDFVDGLENRGFSFNNPNATETCGCGTSFNA
jgi:iron-sulfur cluster assembly protein